MLDINAGALPSLGWDGRVEALFAEIARPGLLPGRIVRVERSACVVGLAGGDQMANAPVGLAVGDWVAVRVADDHVAVVAVAERWSQLTRGDPSGDHSQVLAANVDLVLIAAPADRLSPARVEREAAMAWDSGVRPVVVVTKADLAGAGAVSGLQARLVGVDVIATSAVSGLGLVSVGAVLRPGRTAVLIGPSGAGKSSLANAVLGADVLATGAVRQADHRGRHTTTSRQLVAVPDGGVLIDTPGLRSLALTGDGGGIDATFGDIDALAAECRFGDCRHDREPGCAVLAAAASGHLDRGRLVSYRKLKAEAAHQERRLDPRARQEALRVWKARTRQSRSMPKRR